MKRFQDTGIELDGRRVSIGRFHPVRLLPTSSGRGEPIAGQTELL